jgi:hypothetical protein
MTMDNHVTELHKAWAHAMLTDVDGKMLHPVDVALLVARLLADAEVMKNHILDLEDSRVAHG